MKNLSLTIIVIFISFSVSAQWTYKDSNRYIYTSKNVSIGTNSSPNDESGTKKLWLEGDKRGTITLASKNNSSVGSSFGKINFRHGGSYNKTFGSILCDRPNTNGSATMKFKTRSASNGLKDVMILTQNHNVLIGTTSNPGYYKLAVNGKVRAREIVVENSNWSDFVFEASYNLPTLEEVEAYIKKNGHLKDIPSEKEVYENGIQLSEMTSKLLQKIEELTLYTIEQDKKIKNLETLINNINKK